MQSPPSLPRSVRTLLQEAGVPDDDPVAAALAELGRLADGDAPVPSARLAPLLAGRRPRHRRGAVIALVVAASLGTGITAAAADPAIRSSATHAVAGIVAPHVDLPRVVEEHPSARPTTPTPALPEPTPSSSIPNASPSPSPSVQPERSRRPHPSPHPSRHEQLLPHPHPGHPHPLKRPHPSIGATLAPGHSGLHLHGKA